MAKVLSEHDHITAAAIISNASSGIATMVQNGTTVECTMLPQSGIKNAIGESQFGLGYLSMSNKVNHFSYFGPKAISRNAQGGIDITTKTPYAHGNWAGYNHYAKPCSYYRDKSLTTFNLTKNSSYQFTFVFDIVRGETPPPGVPNGWTYCRLKVVITDTTYTRTLTGYSLIMAVASTYWTTFVVAFTDDAAHNSDFTGTATITLEYVNSTGATIYGYGEDSYPTATVNVKGYYYQMSQANFANTLPPGITMRFYYKWATVPPYNQLVYLDYTTAIKLCNVNGYNNYNTDGNMIISRNQAGDVIGDPHPDNVNWPLVFVATYDVNTGIYRKFTLSTIAAGTIFDTIYKAPTDMGRTYKLTYNSRLSGWPTTL